MAGFYTSTLEEGRLNLKFTKTELEDLISGGTVISGNLASPRAS
jgi:hypothetical protein